MNKYFLEKIQLKSVAVDKNSFIKKISMKFPNKVTCIDIRDNLVNIELNMSYGYQSCANINCKEADCMCEVIDELCEGLSDVISNSSDCVDMDININIINDYPIIDSPIFYDRLEKFSLRYYIDYILLDKSSHEIILINGSNGTVCESKCYTDGSDLLKKHINIVEMIPEFIWQRYVNKDNELISNMIKCNPDIVKYTEKLINMLNDDSVKYSTFIKTYIDYINLNTIFKN